jgi:hypothetical protein
MRETRNGTHWVTGYFAAVLSGSFTFVLILLAVTAVHTGNVQRLVDLAAMGLVILIVVTFFASFTAWLPILLVHIIVTRFPINRATFFIIVGAVTGYMQALWVLRSYFHSENITLELIGVPSGAVAGFVFWFVTGRFVNRAMAPVSRPH